jgi:hypothetical protein
MALWVAHAQGNFAHDGRVGRSRASPEAFTAAPDSLMVLPADQPECES